RAGLEQLEDLEQSGGGSRHLAQYSTNRGRKAPYLRDSFSLTPDDPRRQENGMSETATIGSTAHDFDFLMGSWHVRNLRLRERLAGSNDWEEFEATSVARPLLDGLGNEDEFRTDHDGGFIGMSLR